MKNQYLIIRTLILTAIVYLTGCGNDGGPEVIDQFKERTTLLSVTWNIVSVTQNGVDISASFTGAKVEFKIDNNFTSTVQAPYDAIWPSSGTWSLSTTDVNLITVNGIDMNISNATQTSLTLDFSYLGASIQKEGKITALDGNYVMNFTKAP